MNTRDFLSTIWGADDAGDLRGVGIVAEKLTKGVWQNYYKNISEAARQAGEVSALQKDAYFAPALFKDVVFDSETGDASNTGNRKKEKAIGAWCFWLDIDVGEAKAAKGEGYATQADALQALRDFCQTTGLPRPTLIVSSGYGVHCYWLMSEFVPRECWIAAAQKLKALTLAQKFKADPTRTADIASVLRPVGTLNFKRSDDPRPVEVLHPPEGKAPKRIDLAGFEKALEAALPSPPASGSAAKPTLLLPGSAPPHAAGVTDGNLQREGFPPSSALEINKHCPTLAHVAGVLGVVSEPLWRAAMGVWKHTTEGDAQCHEWSKGDPRYDEVEAQRKIDGWTAGPTLCETFRAWTDTKCDGCSHTCKSPISLGRVVTVTGEAGALDGEVIPPSAACPGQLATLPDFNNRFFVAPLGGGTFIFDRMSENLIAEGMTEHAFNLRFRYIRDKDGPVILKWLGWAQRTTYDRIVFDPSGEAREGEYNSWSGLAVEAQKGECSLILGHIHDVLCGGNNRVYTYVIGWLALLVQRPWEKPGVALVMKSREGAGKSIIAGILLEIFGQQHGFTTASKDAVAGRFNAHLYDKVFIVLEEAFFAGDNAAVAAAKMLITSPVMSYEAKGKDAAPGRNFAHVMFLTNHDWAIPASEDARRFMVLDVSDERIGDHAYFKALANEIKNGGAAALRHYLESIDLTGFNPRKRPETLALADQRRQTLLHDDPVKAWWLDGLTERGFALQDGTLDWEASVDADMLRQSYEHATRRARHAPPFSVAMRIVWKLMPAGSLTKHRPRGGNMGRRYAYHLPPLNEARAKFRQATGVEVDANGPDDPAPA